MTKRLKICILAVSTTFTLLSLQGCNSFTGGNEAELNGNNSSMTDTSSDPVSTSSATTDASTSMPSSVAPKTESEIIPETTEQIIKRMVSTHFDENSYLSVLIHDDNKTLEITAHAEDNLTTGMIRDGILLGMKDTLKDIKSFNFNKVLIYIKFPVGDAYGNTSIKQVAFGFFKKEDIDKINFENFNCENIPNVATNYSQSPMFDE